MAQARNRWIGLVFISMAISLVIIDGTIVNTIFPALIQDLSLTSTEVQWVQESYVLVFASLLLVWGSLADRIGRRLLLSIGIVIFILSSVWAGVTDSASALILARVIQGIGGAMVLPTTLSLVNANFQGKERGIAFAVWGATIGGMVAHEMGHVPKRGEVHVMAGLRFVVMHTKGGAVKWFKVVTETADA